LKSKTKSAYPEERWNDNDEREFTNKLERELEKCEDFQLTKAEELSERIESLEKTVHGLVKAYDSQQGNGNDDHEDKPSASQLESQDQDAEALDGGSDDEDDGADDDDDTRSEASYDEKFKDMEEEVATLVADVHDLALYTKLNFTGFMKIVKKHDVSEVRCTYVLKLTPLDLAESDRLHLEARIQCGLSRQASFLQVQLRWIDRQVVEALRLGTNTRTPHRG
jgi:SPX domain protein involved in polyphosphate accumulation